MTLPARGLVLDRDAVRAYLAALYEPEDVLQIEVYPKPNPSQRPAARYSFKLKQLNERVLARLEQLNDGPTYGNLYVRTNPLNRVLERQSACEDDVAVVRHLWLDLDNCPPGDAARRFEAAGWPAADLILESGGVGRPGNTGVQAFFKLAAPVALEPGSPQGGYVKAIVRAALTAMHDDPSTATLHRLMRLPSWNVKHPEQHEPRPARILHQQPADEAERWTLDQWGQALGVTWDPDNFRARPVLPPGRPNAPTRPGKDRGEARPLPVVGLIYEKCAWLRQCRDQAATLKEPDWYAALGIVGLCQDGRAAAHQLSAPYPHYTHAETEAKLDHALQAAGPATCARIHASHADLCSACVHWGKITSPIELGYRRRPRITAATALAVKAEILERAKTVDGRVMVTAILENAAELEQLAWLAQHDRANLQALLHRLVTDIVPADNRLSRREADDLLKVIDQVAEKTARRERRAAAKADERGTPILDVLKDAPVSADHVVPAGYEINTLGLFVEKAGARGGEPYMEKVSDTPMLITGVLVDVESNAHAVQIAYRQRGHWKQTIVPRDKLATSVEIIVALATYGCDVTSANKMDVVRWFAAYEARNKAYLARTETTGALGWQPGPRFLLGTQVISPTGVQPIATGDPRQWPANSLMFRPKSPGDELLLGAYRTAGTLDGWLAAVAPLAEYPLVLVGIYAALAAPLLQLLKLPPIIVHFADRTSTGKTTALKVAASTCGCPDERERFTVIQSWAATINAVSSMCAILRHLPLFLDDTRKIRKLEELTQVIYDFSGGKERARRNQEGGLQEVGWWKTIMVSTGEAKLTDYAADQEGAHARVIDVWGRPFGDKNELTGQVVDRVKLAIEEHYGHALPALLQYVLAHYDQVDTWREWAAQSRAGFVAAFLDAGVKSEHLARRIADSLSGLQLAATLAHAALPLPWEPPDLWETLRGALIEGIEGADTARVALQILLEDAVQRRAEYFNAREPRTPPVHGWRGRWDGGRTSPVWFMTATVREVLGKAQIDARRVLRAWADSNWLLRDGSGKTTVPMSVDGPRVRMLGVPSTVADEIMGSDDEAAESEARYGTGGLLPGARHMRDV